MQCKKRQQAHQFFLINSSAKFLTDVREARSIFITWTFASGRSFIMLSATACPETMFRHAIMTVHPASARDLAVSTPKKDNDMYRI